MRTIVLLSAATAATCTLARPGPTSRPAVTSPTPCETFTAARQLMRLGYASSYPFRDGDQILRAKALLWAYPGGCRDATFHHIASRLILSDEGAWTAEQVVGWGRVELSVEDVDPVTFETFRTLLALMSGRGLIDRIDWRPARDPALLREQYHEVRLR